MSNPSQQEAPEVEQVEQRGARDGNTGKRPSQHKYWCFTLNNWQVEQVEHLEQTLKGECQWYVFQEETGEEGTPHLQGTICLKARQRLGQLKVICDKAHWEPTRSVNSSIAYCTKRDTRTGALHSFGIDLPKPVRTLQPRGWQMQVMRLITEDPHPRKIHWFWEERGNVGKSTLCKHLVVEHGAILVSGKSADVAHALSKRKNIRLVLVDVPRVSADYVNYGVIEAVKNGLLFSGKYDSAQVVFDIPHVIVFANIEPKYENMSADRWDVHYINPMDGGEGHQLGDN